MVSICSSTAAAPVRPQSKGLGRRRAGRRSRRIPLRSLPGWQARSPQRRSSRVHIRRRQLAKSHIVCLKFDRPLMAKHRAFAVSVDPIISVSPAASPRLRSAERCPRRSGVRKGAPLLCYAWFPYQSLAVRGYLSCSTGKPLLTPLDPRASATNRPRTGIETSIAMAAASKVTTAVAIERASAPCNIGNPSMTE